MYRMVRKDWKMPVSEKGGMGRKRKNGKREINENMDVGKDTGIRKG